MPMTIYDTPKTSPALSSRIRGKSCTGTLGKWRLLLDVRKGKHSASSVQGRRSVEDAKSSPKAMDIGKIVREEDGFWLRKAREPGGAWSLVPDHRARSPKKMDP